MGWAEMVAAVGWAEGEDRVGKGGAAEVGGEVEAVDGEGRVGCSLGEGGWQGVAGDVEEAGDDIVLELHGELHGRADVAGDHGPLEVHDGRLHEVACAD